MKKIILSICALTLISACDNDFAKDDIIVKINTEVLSKAPQLDESGAGNFQTGDEIYLTAQGNISGKWYADKYVLGESMLYWSDLEMNEDTEVSFSACYPIPNNINGTSFDFNIVNSTYKDLLVTRKINVKKGEPVNMSFKHAMHKLSINYISSDNSLSDLENTKVSCKAMTVCSIDLKKPEITENNASSLGNYDTINGNNINFLVVPQNTINVELTLSFANGKVITKSLYDFCNGSILKLESGKELKLTFDITDNNIQVITNHISGWGEQGNIDDNIII